MDNDRALHSLGVAKKMVEIGQAKGYNEEQLEELFLLGIVHDIGYEYEQTGKDHRVIGSEILKNCGYKYYKEVLYHGSLPVEYHTDYLVILNQADMQIDKYGHDVGYDKRLEDIASRYGTGSIIYKECQELVEQIRNL